MIDHRPPEGCSLDPSTDGFVMPNKTSSPHIGPRGLEYPKTTDPEPSDTDKEATSGYQKSNDPGDPGDFSSDFTPEAEPGYRHDQRWRETQTDPSHPTSRRSLGLESIASNYCSGSSENKEALEQTKIQLAHTGKSDRKNARNKKSNRSTHDRNVSDKNNNHIKLLDMVLNTPPAFKKSSRDLKSQLSQDIPFRIMQRDKPNRVSPLLDTHRVVTSSVQDSSGFGIPTSSAPESSGQASVRRIYAHNMGSSGKDMSRKSGKTMQHWSAVNTNSVSDSSSLDTESSPIHKPSGRNHPRQRIKMEKSYASVAGASGMAAHNVVQAHADEETKNGTSEGMNVMKGHSRKSHCSYVYTVYTPIQFSSVYSHSI